MSAAAGPQEFGFSDYARHGWVLTPIDPGQKRPTGKAWNQRTNCITHPLAAARLPAAGLCHAYSGPSPTCAIDIDELTVAVAWLAERGIDLNEMLLAPDAVQIRSPAAGHAKLLYTLPAPLPSKKLAEFMENGKRRMALELRCGTADGLSAQDLLPPSPHPLGGCYEWAGDGDWRELPPLPESLHALWVSLCAPVEHKAEKTVDTSRLAALLEGLDADLPRDEWYKAGMAVHHETDGSEQGFQLWHEWSKRGEKYQGEKDCRAVWNSFTPGGGITGQSLVQMVDGTVNADEFPIVSITQPSTAAAGAAAGAAAVADPVRALPINSVLMKTPKLKPVEFVIDGFLPTGLTVIAGAEGVGKTSLLVPLAAAAAHLIKLTDIPIELRRKVVYVAEDTGQVERALYGLWKHANDESRRDATTCTAAWDEWWSWFTVLPAKRVLPDVWGSTVAAIVESHSDKHNGYRVGPLIVLDTMNATLDVQSENDNAEAGRAVSGIKENLGRAACWAVTHVPKNLTRGELEDLVIRGAGAWSGDANATAFIGQEPKGLFPNRRFMLTRKVRFERTISELQFDTHADTEGCLTPWGSMQLVTYRYGLPSRSSVEERKENRAQAQEQAKVTAAVELREEIMECIRETPRTKTEVRRELGKNKATVSKVIDDLLDEGLLEKTKRPTGRPGPAAQVYSIAEPHKLETMQEPQP